MKELEHLAVLSRIKLSEDDKKSLIKEFDSILGYIDQLKKAQVSMDSSARVGALRNVARQDATAHISTAEAKAIAAADRERLLDEAPDREGDFVAVKKIIAQDIKL